ncbi:hypothetical protein E2C01_083641 [Portunus trituberculatus]|uniref:Uncharacterized protein n=1 Tax=Portunus trituberculatus TaxID=210409 RepID=A0A5B7IXQ3_PORTR|nr:hypothetical protein [Portunus trituberculatus]
MEVNLWGSEVTNWEQHEHTSAEYCGKANVDSTQFSSSVSWSITVTVLRPCTNTPTSENTRTYPDGTPRYTQPRTARL